MTGRAIGRSGVERLSATRKCSSWRGGFQCKDIFRDLNGRSWRSRCGWLRRRSKYGFRWLLTVRRSFCHFSLEIKFLVELNTNFIQLFLSNPSEPSLQDQKKANSAARSSADRRLEASRSGSSAGARWRQLLQNDEPWSGLLAKRNRSGAFQQAEFDRHL